MFKRTLCALLALLCVVGMLPVSALATEEVPQTVETTPVLEEQLSETEPTVAETEPTTEPTAEPTEESAPVTEPTEETAPVTEPTEETAPVTEPTEETEPVTESTEETEPVTEPTEESAPVTEPTEETAPVTEPTEETAPVTEPAEEETTAVTEEAAEEDFLISDIAADTYYKDSAYYEYYWWNEEYDEIESNNSRGGANIVPIVGYNHFRIDGSTRSDRDAYDYFRFKVTETSYLKLLVQDGHSYSHTKYRLYNSGGTVLSTAPRKDSFENGYGSKDSIYYMTYVLNPGTYYIGVYQPTKAGYSYIGSSYRIVVHLYPRLDKPTVSLSSNKSTGKPIVSWNYVSDAEYYKVYRATSKNGTYSLKATTYDRSWTDTGATAGKTYYYKVQAFSSSSTYNESNNKSSMSAVKSRVCDLPRPSVTASNAASSGKVKLTWNAISGAKSYQVYRATSSDGEYTLMKTVTGTSYTNTNAKAGKTYYYKVKAIHKSNSNANSAYSTVVSRLCDLARPSLTMSNAASTGKVKISWKAIEGAAYYEIYRSTSSSGTYRFWDYVEGTSYTDHSTDPGVAYYYKVKAIHSNSDANSAYSTAKYRTCDLPRPVVEIARSNGKPRLTWEPIDGAVQYKVYRATAKNGTYSLVKTTSGTSYTNTGAKAGVTYYYKVMAIHESSSANSAYSQIDSIRSK